MTSLAVTPTKERLTDAAAELLDELGPDGVTMRSVGQRIGLSAMASYRHHADRDALLQTVADRGFAELALRFREREDASLEQHFDSMREAFVDLALQRPHLFALMFTGPRNGARDLATQAEESPTLRVLIASLDRGVHEGAFVAHDQVEVAISVAALLQGLCLARYAERIGLPDNEFRAMCRRCVERILDGIRA